MCFIQKVKGVLMSPREIKEIRSKLKITQEKFAAMLGTTTTTVNRWEQGKVIPSRLYTNEILKLKEGHADKAC